MHPRSSLHGMYFPAPFSVAAITAFSASALTIAARRSNPPGADAWWWAGPALLSGRLLGWGGPECCPSGPRFPPPIAERQELPPERMTKKKCAWSVSGLPFGSYIRFRLHDSNMRGRSRRCFELSRETCIGVWDKTSDVPLEISTVMRYLASAS